MEIYHVLSCLIIGYADHIVTYPFLIFPLIWCMINAVISTQKPQFCCFTFPLVNVNPIIFDKLRVVTSWNLVWKFNPFEVLVPNSPLKLHSKSQSMIYFNIRIGIPCHSICRKLRWIVAILFNYNFSWRLLFIGI